MLNLAVAQVRPDEGLYKNADLRPTLDKEIEREEKHPENQQQGTPGEPSLRKMGHRVNEAGGDDN